MTTSELEHLQSAMITAWVRAIESKREDSLFDDPYADLLSGRPNLEFLCIRTRLFDDELLETLSFVKGRCQIVILGAGMDTRALRLRALSTIPVFEVDLPAIVTTKSHLMSQHQLHRDKYVRIGADLEGDDWPGLLKEKGFQVSVATIWIAEGLITYLDADKCLELLEKMYANSALGSVVIADIPDQSASGKNQRIRFTCNDPDEWFAKGRWTSVTAIKPENHTNLRNRFESVNQQIRIFRAVKQYG